MTVSEVYDFINSFAPFDSQLGFDNAGVMIGSMDTAVRGIGVCLDVTDSAVQFAMQNQIDLIVSHHPLIWDKLAHISANSTVYRLIQSGISVISAHTNLDAASGGVCEALCEALGVGELEKVFLPEFPDTPIARVGTLQKSVAADAFAKSLKSRLGAPDIRYVAERDVYKIGVFNGAGSDLIPIAAAMGCDSVVTSDIKHHEWLRAKALGMNLFDAGHFSTERVIVPVLTARLNSRFGDIAQAIPESAPYLAV